MIKLRKIIKSLILSAIGCFIFFLPMFGVSGGLTAAAETSDNSDVMKELHGLTIDGKEFSSDDYPADESGTPRVLTVYENGYNYYANKRENYGLTLYVYNPAQLYVQDDSRNTVQMRAGKAARYDKYKISIESVSADKLFYKFKVAFTEQEKSAVLSALDKDSRTYEISSIELYTNGYNATDYGLSHTQIFTFTGYAAGCGKDNGESTLTSTLSYTIAGGIATESLEVHHTSWRPDGTNGNSEYTQDVVHSVYFAVPNRYTEQYDYLNSVKARWIEARTAPIWVTGNKDLIQVILELIAKQIADATIMGTGLPEKFNFDGLKYHLVSPSNQINANTNTREIYFGNDDYYSNYNYTDYGIPNFYHVVNQRLKSLYLVGYAESAGVLTASEVEKVVQEATTNLRDFNDYKVADKYPSFLFDSWDKDFHTEVIEVGIKDKELNLNSEKVERNFWDRLFGTSHVENSEQFKNIKAIQQVTGNLLYGSREEVCNRLYISERDYDDFAAFYDKAQKEKSTVYLLRFAVSEYWRAPVEERKENKTWYGNYSEIVSNGYFAQANCYLDFDVIDLEYKKNDESYVLPVVMSPIDIFTELTPPPFSESNDFWKYAVGTMAGLTALYAVYKIGGNIYDKSRRGL